MGVGLGILLPAVVGALVAPAPRWRVYDVTVSVDEDPGAGSPPDEISAALEAACAKRVQRALGLSQAPGVRVVEVVRKSIDTRKRGGRGPRWVYAVDAEVSSPAVKAVPGVLEGATAETPNVVGSRLHPARRARVVVVGSGPAGLFCALELASRGLAVHVVERGRGVEKRGADIGRLVHRRQLNLDSNFAFGEGGAGTWSDGKLVTRVGRNGDEVRAVLRTLVAHGAPERILRAGAPHLGTEILVRILRSLRHTLEQELGATVLFDSRVEGFDVKNGACVGVVLASGRTIRADAVVVATGHSADDVYAALLDAGAELRPKPLAVGFRVEHPQALVNRLTYGALAERVVTGRRRTDVANGSSGNAPRLPVASYRLACDVDGRSVYSFCMCPGGQIVPATTHPDLMVVNGMSFSRRDSLFANAALVVSVDADDDLLGPYAHRGPLRTLAFQRDLERQAALLGGGNFVCPVHPFRDLVSDAKPVATSPPASSYRLGVRTVDLRHLLPPQLTQTLAAAALDHFERQMPGFVSSPHGLLHAVETRTSAPVRVPRDPHSLQSTTLSHLYPAGEGAGYAGGIVSAAVDGIRVARAVAADCIGGRDHLPILDEPRPDVAPAP